MRPGSAGGGRGGRGGGGGLFETVIFGEIH